MSNNPYRTVTDQQNSLRAILHTAAQSIRFNEDVTNFILKIAKDSQFIDQKITNARNQLENALGGNSELAKFKTANDVCTRRNLHSFFLLH